MVVRKVLWLNWRDVRSPLAGGAEIYIYEVARRLIKMGYEITQFAAEFPNLSNEDLMDGIKIVRNGDRYTVYLKAKNFYDRNKGDIDLVVDSINTLPFFTPLYVSKKYKVSLIFQLTGQVFYKVMSNYLACMASCIERCIYRMFYRGIPTIVLSQSVKDELTEIGFPKESIYVAEPGVNLNYYTIGHKADCPTVLYLNRLVPYKNVEDLIGAFRILLGRISNAKLFIVGCRGTKYEDYLRRLVRDLDLSNSVSFYKFATGEEKRRYLQKAWIHVLPSTKEGWGISVTEAAACGTPTVAYDVVGLKNSVKHGETGFLVPYKDIRALASSMIRLLSDEDLRRRMSIRAREEATKLTWDRTTSIINNAIERAQESFNL